MDRGPVQTESMDVDNRPRAIGRYAVTGLLGEGGMGVVYAAHDAVLDRPVAIKMIRPAVDDGESRDRLIREARAAASLNHPAICQVYEAGDEHGQLFLAMELLQGESLATRMARGPMSIQEAGVIALGILSGAEALHARGLIHRDLKPSNIFLTPHGVKLLDFGLTMPRDASMAETGERLTRPGMMMGTPQYMAPEQLGGQEVDQRADLFSTAVVIYEMLAGRVPFPGRTPIEILHAVVYEHPPVLTGSPAVVAIDRVLNRALAKRPQDRCASAAELARDLRTALAAVDSGTIVAPRAVTRLIVLPFRVLGAGAETDFLAFGLADAITSALSGLESLVVRSSLVAAGFASETPNLAEIAASAEVDAVVIGTVMRAGGQLRVSTQLVELPAAAVLWSQTTQIPMGDLFTVQDDLTTRIIESLSVPLSARERRMLKQDVPATPAVYERYLRANELNRESGGWRAAVDLYQQCVIEDPGYAPAWAGLGRVHRMLWKYGEHETERDEHRERSERALRRALEINPDLSAAENVLAHLDVDLGRAEQAMVRLLGRARQRPADPDLYSGIAYACRYCGLLTASLAAVEQARRFDPKIRTSGALSLFAAGQYEAALHFQSEPVPYLHSLALGMLGRQAEALDVLEALPVDPNNRLVHFLRALQCLFRNEAQASMAALEPIIRLPDPEGKYYFGRNAAYLGMTAHALALLGEAVDGGFFCLPSYAHDPWLDSLRGTDEFASLLRRAEARHRRALFAFLDANGDRVLGVSHPV